MFNIRFPNIIYKGKCKFMTLYLLYLVQMEENNNIHRQEI